LQHGFHDEQNLYSRYGNVQRGVVSTCWILGYVTMIVHNCKKSSASNGAN
jgi:hypothetical protein